MADRVERLLGGLDLARGRGLEIGALHRPMLRRPTHDVHYLDHADTATLRRKYANDAKVQVAEIVDVDLVWTGETLAALAGDFRFDHVIASHVIEHVPDVLWWLHEIAGVLRPFGALRLAVPDGRFTFDFLRAETTTADLLAAWFERRRRPDARGLLDFWGFFRQVDAAAAWRGEYPPDRSFRIGEMTAALQRCQESAESGAYHDIHCSVFTPASFAKVMRDLARLDRLEFACADIQPTCVSEAEFFVHLMRSDDRDKIRGSWDWAVWRVGTGYGPERGRS